MERIKQIKERTQNEFYVKRDIDFFEAQEDIEYLLAENKRLREALERVANSTAREIMRKYALEALKQE